MIKTLWDNGEAFIICCELCELPCCLYFVLEWMNNLLFQGISRLWGDGSGAASSWTIFESQWMQKNLLRSVDDRRQAWGWLLFVCRSDESEHVYELKSWPTKLYGAIRNILRINIWHDSNIVTEYFHYVPANIYLISMISFFFLACLASPCCLPLEISALCFLWSGCKCFVSKLICFKIFQRNGEKYVFLLPIGHRFKRRSRILLEPYNHVDFQFISEIACKEFAMLNYFQKILLKFRKALHYVHGFANNFSTRTFPPPPYNQPRFHDSSIYYTNRIFVRETFFGT